MPPLTFDELNALPTVVDLMTAARALGIGRTKAYQLAKASQFPCRIIRVGNGYHIPTADLMKVLVLQRQIFTRPAAISREVNSGCNRDQWNSTTPKLI